MSEPCSTDAIVIPVRNRRETTMRALRNLGADGVLSWATVVVVDDGSTDGTKERVRRDSPSVVLLEGDGSWWWGGAIRRGMDWALAHHAARIFWLNDDCEVPPGGLEALREAVRQTDEVAWIDCRTPNGWSYGAHRRTLTRIRRCTSAEELRGQIDAFSGNCVCLPRQWVERVGLPHDHLFPHGLADLDYGLRLRGAGARLHPLRNIVAMGADPSPDSSESWLASPRSMRAVWSDFSTPKSFLYFPAWRKFALRHWGPLWGWVVFGLPYFRWLLIAGLRTMAPAFARALVQRRLK